MSLINDMLNDLEHRQQRLPERPDNPLTDLLRAVPSNDVTERPKLWLVATLGLVVVAAGSYSGTRWLRSAFAAWRTPVAATALAFTTPPAIAETARANLRNTVTPAEDPAPAANATRELETGKPARPFSLRLATRIEPSRLPRPTTRDERRFAELLDAAPPAAIVSRAPVDHTADAPAIPATAPGEGWAQPLHVASVSPAPAMRKTARAPTAAERAGARYRQALALIRAGNQAAGDAALAEVLEIQPKHNPARTLLAARRVRAGDLQAADELLAQGMAANPEDAELAKTRARVLVAMERIDDALAVLRRSKPAAKNDPDYYAFHAALAQRVGDHATAVGLYQNALLTQPGNGVWWMGLGISLEAIGSRNEAARAYRKARGSGLRQTEVRRFVEARLAALSS